jgi:hypothetical protein
MNSWFGKSGPANIGSIEVSYVTMAKMLVEYGGGSWVPNWYAGFPVNLIYTPLVPVVEAVLVGWGVGYWEAYRLVVGVGYIIAPISVMFLVWKLSRSWVGGLVAGVMYSVMPSVFYWLYGGLAKDRLATDFWDPRRFTIVVRWGEGPHTVALAFVPLIGWALASYWDSKHRIWLVLTAVFFAATGLTNAIGLVAGVILVAVMAFVRLAQQQAKMELVRGLVVVGLGSAGLMAFWYNLTFVSNFFGEGGGVIARAMSLFPWGWLVGMLGLSAVYVLVSRVIKDFGVAVSLVLAAVFLTVVGVYYFSAPDSLAERRIELLPQALRYTTESDLALAMVVGSGWGWLVRRRNKMVSYGLGGLGLIVAAGLVVYGWGWVRWADQTGGSEVRVQQTEEMAVAKWLESKSPSRVWVTGNHGYYLNYFTDVPQIRGGLYQANLLKWPEHAHYQLVNGLSADLARKWLDIFGVDYVVLPGPASEEIYKEVGSEVMNKFAFLENVGEVRGSFLYKVPQGVGLAQVVRLRDGDNLTKIGKADDSVGLGAYVSWLKAVNRPVEVVENKGKYQIGGQLGAGEGIRLAITYDGGWQAEGYEVEKDPLGFVVLVGQPGVVKTELSHHLTWDVYLGYVVTVMTGVGLVGYMVWPKK